MFSSQTVPSLMYLILSQYFMDSGLFSEVTVDCVYKPDSSFINVSNPFSSLCYVKAWRTADHGTSWIPGCFSEVTVDCEHVFLCFPFYISQESSINFMLILKHDYFHDLPLFSHTGRENFTC